VPRLLTFPIRHSSVSSAVAPVGHQIIDTDRRRSRLKSDLAQCHLRESPSMVAGGAVDLSSPRYIGKNVAFVLYFCHAVFILK
jgi:hypothetical protein